MSTTRQASGTVPVPRPTRISAPFWSAAREHRLALQYCIRCRTYIYYPRPFCTSCLSEALEWREVSGRGRIHTFTVVRRAASSAFADKVPYVFAIVKLDEGPLMSTNVVGCPPGDVRMDMAVRAVFEDVSDDIALVKFEPAE